MYRGKRKCHQRKLNSAGVVGLAALVALPFVYPGMGTPVVTAPRGSARSDPS
jgi:hypothetical protein